MLEINWRFGVDFIPEIIENNLHDIKLCFKNSDNYQMHIKSNCKIKAKIFNYDFSPYYGSKYLCSGVNISTDNNNAGYINTKILISC